MGAVPFIQGGQKDSSSSALRELVALATSTALCFRRGLLLAILADFPTDEVNGKLLDFVFYI